MPLISTRTKRQIGTFIDPDLENKLDDESLNTQLNMLNQLDQKNKLSKTTSAQFNYLHP